MANCANGLAVIAVLCVSVGLQAYAHVLQLNDVHYMSNNKPKVYIMSSFSWNDCGEPSYPGHLKSLTLKPDPLDLPGNISLAFEGTLNASLASPITLDLQVQKKVIFWITVPCIDHFGSCNYHDICPLLVKLDCPPIFQKHGIPCKCPIAAGEYNLPPAVFFVDDSFLPGFLTNGYYRVTANLLQNDKKIACVHTEFEITR